MLRYVIVTVISASIAVSQSEPAFQWVKEVDSTGGDTVAGLGVDAAGNTYIAGSTSSPDYVVKNAVQPHSASAGLYRIDGPGSDYTRLGLSAASQIVIDPQSPNTLYAIAFNPAGGPLGLFRSTDGGTTFTALTVPAVTLEDLAIDPSNDQILYLGTFDQGLLKSLDGGATWAHSNGAFVAPSSGFFDFQYVWIDPNNPQVLFANALGNFVRSADAGASWQILYAKTDVTSVTFNSAVRGLVYATTILGPAMLSTDDGQTFSNLTTPTEFGIILADPNHAGRLLASGSGAIYVSTDNGQTWSAGINLGFIANTALFAADWASGYLYTGNQSVQRITADLQTVTPLGPPAIGNLTSIAVGNGHVYVTTPGSHDAFVTKLDAAGNIVYSTFFGGAGDDLATGMTVDRAGNVYVTGTTTSGDFPVTKGTYASTGGSFVFKLNPDGSVAYSTYFAPPGSSPASIAVDATGSIYLAGDSRGNLPITPGAYQPNCNCTPVSTGFERPARTSGPSRDLTIFFESGFVSKLDPAAATLVYSTYLGGTTEFLGDFAAFAVSGDGSAYLGTNNGIFHLNATGSALLGSIPQATINTQAITVAPDGSVLVVGTALQFPTTPGAFQSSFVPPPAVPGQGGLGPGTVIARWDAQLANILSATYFGTSKQTFAIALDSAGNVYLGGRTGPKYLPTRAPIQAGFASETGFMSELSADLSKLLFSSYFGDSDDFTVQGLAVRGDGNVILGGNTAIAQIYQSGPYNVWVNSVIVTPPPALRIDSVVNAASLVDGAIAAGETMVVRGAGFDASAQLTIGGVAIQPISITSTAITAIVPQNVPAAAPAVQVTSGGAVSNQVLVPVAATAPGIFSQDGSGAGQGYILNKDGTFNTPSNPAKPGDPISVFATGVGPIAITDGYAVSQYPVAVFVDGFFCNGIEAFLRTVPGLPGDVFEIQVYVPNPAALVSANPNLKDFVFPPLVGVTMQVNGVQSQYGITFSVAPQ